LLGQIRSQFQDQFLITQKDKDSEEYFKNEHWEQKLPFLNDDKQEDIQRYLAEFSNTVDTLTSHLKNDLIQIKTHSRNNHGLFDYTYPNSNLLYLFNLKFQKVTDYDIFLDSVFVELWKQTNRNLEIIRHHVSNVTKEEFIGALDELDARLKGLKLEAKEFQELLTHIISCKTNINYELDKIADWFQIRETVVKEFKFDKVIDTSIEITNKLSQETKIFYCTKRNNSTTILKGKFFVNLFDLLKIFFENTVKYSRLSTKELRVIIEVEEIEKVLNIIIRNNLNPQIDIEELKAKFDQKRKALDSANWEIDRTKKEEGTGFYKAKKTLTTDLLDENNTFSFDVNDLEEVEIKITIHLKSLEV
jgi:hypothetical protein